MEKKMLSHFKKFLKLMLLLLAAFCILNLMFAIRPVKKEDLALDGDGCLVLCYHRVMKRNPLVELLNNLKVIYGEDKELSLYSVYSHDLDEQISFLKENGAHFITIDDLCRHINEGLDIPSKSVLITFDDVDISVYNNAFPILLRHKVPFTLFLITGHIGDNNFKGLELCTFEQIKEMTDTGYATVGSHTNKFHFIDKEGKPAFLLSANLNNFSKDVAHSIKVLEERFHPKKLYFSYPYGFGTSETDNVLIDMNIHLIFTLEPGIVKQKDSAQNMKRVLVNQHTWDSIQQWIVGRPLVSDKMVK